jgi:hypothetical protein
LSGNTRGRGPNPITNHPGTKGSQTILNLKSSKNNESLNYETLIRSFRKYFGLILSFLYASESNLPGPILPLKRKNYPIYLKLKKELKRNKLLKKVEPQINDYNIGCKITELILLLNNNEEIPLKWKLLYPNHRVLLQK